MHKYGQIEAHTVDAAPPRGSYSAQTNEHCHALFEKDHVPLASVRWEGQFV